MSRKSAALNYKQTLPGPSSQKEPPVSPRPPPQHHVTMNALQVAVVSSIFAEDRGNEMHATCLALCNAFRDGVSLPFLRVCCRTPHSLVHPTLCPESPSALPVTASTAGARSSSGASTTNSSRVLPYRRISSLDLEWNYGDLLRCTPKWPVGVQCIHLTKLSVPLIDISLPTTLTRLSFGDAFTIPWVKHSIVGMAPWWPAGLRELYLGLTFDGSIANVEWPPGLEKLSMPAFTQPIEGARWPAGLETLEFLQRSDINERKRGIYTVPLGVALPLFNSPIAGAETYLPPGLRTLWLSDGFNQDVEDVDWPSQLREVGFGQQFQRSFLQGGSCYRERMKGCVGITLENEHFCSCSRSSMRPQSQTCSHDGYIAQQVWLRLSWR